MNIHFSVQELNDELFKIALRTLERVRPIALDAEQRERFEDAYNTLKGLVGDTGRFTS